MPSSRLRRPRQLVQGAQLARRVAQLARRVAVLERQARLQQRLVARR
jgi:hypothetical protein